MNCRSGRRASNADVKLVSFQLFRDRFVGRSGVAETPMMLRLRRLENACWASPSWIWNVKRDGENVDGLNVEARTSTG